MGCRKRQIRDYIHFIDENKSTNPKQTHFSVFPVSRVAKKSLNYQYNQSSKKNAECQIIMNLSKELVLSLFFAIVPNKFCMNLILERKKNADSKSNL